MSDSWDDDLDSWSDRELRRREIDSEFGDETENWYQKWIGGLIDDDSSID